MTRSRATPAGPPVPTIDEQLERMERESEGRLVAAWGTPKDALAPGTHVVVRARPARAGAPSDDAPCSVEAATRFRQTE